MQLWRVVKEFDCINGEQRTSLFQNLFWAMQDTQLSAVDSSYT